MNVTWISHIGENHTLYSVRVYVCTYACTQEQQIRLFLMKTAVAIVSHVHVHVAAISRTK